MAQNFIDIVFRGVAQPGSAFALGAKGRRFKSCLPDLNEMGFIIHFKNFDLMTGVTVFQKLRKQCFRGSNPVSPT